MVDHSDLIAQFVSVVNSTPEQAEFYLEANNWDLNGAMSNFYEEPNAAVAGSTATRISQDDDDEDDEDFQDIVQSTAPVSSSSSGKRKATTGGVTGKKQGGIATFRDLAKNDSEGEDSSEDEKQTYFAGGEKSGVMLEGPGKKDSNSLVEDILKKAAEGGAGRQSPEQAPAPKKNYFSGSGNRLGSEGESSSSSARPQTPPSRSTSTPEALETVTRNLTFWRNGYSIDDGPLMSYTDPANQEFLSAINKGQAPLRYLNVKPGQPVEMRVAKRMDEDFKEPPKAPPKPFDGSGNRLGSVASSPASSSNTPGAFPGATAAPIPTPRSLEIDEAQPVTSIQIRLADGTRMVARFNHTHTVNDIRGFINASRAGESARPYVLQTTFPKKDLEEVTQTVKDAGLLNAVVLQRYL